MKFLRIIAETIAPIDPDSINIPSTDADVVIANALNIVYFIGGVVAVIVIIVAGIMMATSAGNPANVAKARNMLLFSVIGLVIILIAFTITQFVIGAFS